MGSISLDYLLTVWSQEFTTGRPYQSIRNRFSDPSREHFRAGSIGKPHSVNEISRLIQSLNDAPPVSRPCSRDRPSRVSSRDSPRSGDSNRQDDTRSNSMLTRRVSPNCPALDRAAVTRRGGVVAFSGPEGPSRKSVKRLGELFYVASASGGVWNDDERRNDMGVQSVDHQWICIDPVISPCGRAKSRHRVGGYGRGEQSA